MYDSKKLKDKVNKNKKPVIINSKSGISELTEFINSEQNNLKQFRGLSGKVRLQQPGLPGLGAMELNKSKNNLKTSMEKISFNKSSSAVRRKEYKEDNSSVNKFSGMNTVKKFPNNKSRPITPNNDISSSFSSNKFTKTPSKIKPFIINKFPEKNLEQKEEIDINTTTNNINNKLDLNIQGKDMKKLQEKKKDLDNKKNFDGKMMEIDKINLKNEIVVNDDEDFGYDEFEKDEKLLNKIDEQHNNELNNNEDDEGDEFGKGQEFLNLEEEEELNQPLNKDDEQNKRKKILKRIKDLKGAIVLEESYLSLYTLSPDKYDSNFDKVSSEKIYSKYESIGTITEKM